MNTGIRIAGRYFIIFCLPNQIGKPRLGVTVSKKVSRLAVQRNRVKRMIRESFRLSQFSIPFMDIVVIAKPQCAMQESAELRQDLNKLWLKLGV